uniref:Uncharacterized protein n=1 Tax=Panagrolaimus davidi TaxID=227884 RepID=A0A914Q2G8_9BILA
MLALKIWILFLLHLSLQHLLHVTARRPQYRVSFAQTPPRQIQPQLSEIQSNESVLDQDEEGEEEHVSNNPFSPKTSKSHLTSEANVSFGDLEPVSASETSITAASSTCSRPPGHVSVTQSPPPLQRQVRFEDFEPLTSSYVRPPPTPYVPRRNYSLREIQSSELSSGLLQDYKELLARKEKQPASLRALSFRNQTEIPLTLPRNAFPKPHPIETETNPQRSKVFEFWRKKDQNESLI